MDNAKAVIRDAFYRIKALLELPPRQLAQYFIHEHSHGLLMLAYMFTYFILFHFVDQRAPGVHYATIHSGIDDLIPFWEIFVIPYLLWFFYVAATSLFLYFADRRAFDRYALFLVFGMTVFLLVSVVFPNQLDLRPETMPRDNLFTWLILQVWGTDPAISVCPSIHAYNAIATHLAVRDSSVLGSRQPIVAGSGILCLLIVLSTVFIKQHSVIDVAVSIALIAAAGRILTAIAPAAETVSWRKRLKARNRR